MSTYDRMQTGTISRSWVRIRVLAEAFAGWERGGAWNDSSFQE